MDYRNSLVAPCLWFYSSNPSFTMFSKWPASNANLVILSTCLNSFNVSLLPTEWSLNCSAGLKALLDPLIAYFFSYISWNNSHTIAAILLGGSQICYAFSQLYAFEHAVPTARNGLPLLSACLQSSHCFGLPVTVMTAMNILLSDDCLLHVSVVCAS